MITSRTLDPASEIHGGEGMTGPYLGHVFTVLQWDKGQCLLQSQSRPYIVAHAVMWNDRGQFKCSCESKEFGDPSCKHELYCAAVLYEIKNRAKEPTNSKVA